MSVADGDDRDGDDRDGDDGRGDGDRRRRRPHLRLAVGVGLVALVAALTLDAAVLWSRVDRFPLRRTGSAPGGTTYLLVGSDSREFVTSAEDRVRYGGADTNPGERADVLLLARVDADGGRRLLVVSRDTLVVADGGALIRIAETYGRGGPQGVVDALCTSLGIGVDHVGVSRLDGLRAVVNAIGGVDIELETPVRDPGTRLDLPAGAVHLDGDGVLRYVGARNLEHREANGKWRQRTSDATDRPGRVAEVLGLVASEADVSPWSPIRSQRILWAATTGLSADESMGVSEALAVRGALSGMGSMEFVALPVTTSGGDLSVDELAKGAGAAIDRFEAPSAPPTRCRAPKFPVAER